MASKPRTTGLRTGRSVERGKCQRISKSLSISPPSDGREVTPTGHTSIDGRQYPNRRTIGQLEIDVREKVERSRMPLEDLLGVLLNLEILGH